MKTVKVLNFKGNVYEGTWNEKIYESKNENKDLARIYVNNEAIHITKEELAKITEPIIVEGIMRVREGKLFIEPGYDGIYGTVKIFSPKERKGFEQTKLI